MLVRTAGEIRGKSIVWTARVFAEVPKIAEKSRKQNPFSTFSGSVGSSLDLSSTSLVFLQRGRRTRRLPQNAHPVP
jgi:hypothetical protein